MKDTSPDPKQKAILDAAWQAFATYGFRKTSMDDIAKGAGMSRPALYLHYKGKEEIFRHLVQLYYDMAMADVTEALSTPGHPAEMLTRAFEAQAGPSMEAMLNSPHGTELWDAGAATAADIKKDGEAQLATVYAEWLARDAAAGRVVLSGEPQSMAETICASLRAIKQGGTDFATLMAQLRLLAQMLGNGLVPR